MLNLTKRLACLLKLAFVGACLVGIVYAFAWIMRPDIYADLPEHDPEEVKAIEADRDMTLDLDDPPVLHKTVDYEEGEDADWYPSGESPILAELVEEGHLPPVEERVGPEPAVMTGRHGIGNYGGTWYRIENYMSSRIFGSFLLRWSPLGEPQMPHLAKDWEVSDDAREFTIHLRKGVRWSDGHPFTADDIIYHWEHEAKHFDSIPYFMTIGGEDGDIEKIDDYTVRFIFPEPYGFFPKNLSRLESHLWSPKHYLKQYHPDVGDPDKIEAMVEAQGAPSPRAAYHRLGEPRNPDHPRLWPWIPQTYSVTPPYEYVRNPYYFVVDAEGNQLPYIDRLLFDERDEDMLSITASSGNVTFQLEGIRYDDYTLYMDNREDYDYDVYHWYDAGATDYRITPNINRRIDPDRPETKWKHRLLSDKRFRQALSLAINREEIIKAEYHGVTEPGQVAPGPDSPYHNPRLFKAFTEYDPERANALLDDLGLTERDREGYRTFPDGTQMTFMLHTSDVTGVGPSQFILDDWGDVGVRVMLHDRTNSLFWRQVLGHTQDLGVWTSETEFNPLLNVNSLVPVNPYVMFAPGYGGWFAEGGLYDEEKALEAAEESPAIIRPADDHPVWRAVEARDAAERVIDDEERAEIFDEVLEIMAEELYAIGLCTTPPQPVIVKDGLRNVPRMALHSHDYISPGNAGPETYFFEEPPHAPRIDYRVKYSLLHPRPNPRLSLEVEVEDEDGSRLVEIVGSMFRYLILGIVLLFVLLIVFKHPFIARRCLVLIPTLLVMSIIIFTVMDLPPGDYIEHLSIELEAQGDEFALSRLEELREIFRLDDSLPVRYLHWMGFYWFGTFDSADTGLMQGDLGMSMEHQEPVADLVGDRILFSFLIAFLTILFTWAVAVPIGIYSAVRQYSIGDYSFTVLGFLGMSIPNFLLALVLMYIGTAFFNTHVGGLFSPEYAAQPEWSFGKVIDLLKHIWLPVVVVGTAGTAGMIRVMRANLLDELRKPYVVTARAKGVRPVKLITKYPVRLALNPFISGIGGIFPQLISGAAITGIVLSLPTIGPLQLEAIRGQDLYLAGSLLMVLSLLAVFGTLVSDLLLMWLDPRIRMGGSQ